MLLYFGDGRNVMVVDPPATLNVLVVQSADLSSMIRPRSAGAVVVL